LINLLSQKAADACRYGRSETQRTARLAALIAKDHSTGADYESANSRRFRVMFFPSRESALCYKNRDKRLIVMKKP
ncbi:TPA: hypothetical protein ACGD8T_005141, partial [Serratia marcescens]